MASSCLLRGRAFAFARPSVVEVLASVFFRQQHGRDRPVGLGDDIEPGLPVIASVGGEQPIALLQGTLVLRDVLLWQLAPVAARMAVEAELDSARGEPLQRPGRDDEMA